MSDSSVPIPVRIHKLPLLIRKSALKKYSQINQLKPDYSAFLQRVENAQQNLFKEEVIYKSKEDDAFFGKYPNLIIKNKLNFARNTSRTVASYKHNSSTVELNSDAVTDLVGQKNYDTVLSALCSVISQDLKIQGILSLLTLNDKKNVPSAASGVISVDTSSQTVETSRAIFLRSQIKRNCRRKHKVRSYAVSDDMLPEKPTKKVIIVPNNEKIKEAYDKTLEKNVEESSNEKCSGSEQLPDLKLLLDEDSNISDTSIGNISINSCNIPNILENPKSILNNIDKHTKDTDSSDLTTVRMIDGSVVMIPGCPDMFHLATKDILQNLSSQDRKKILLHQAYIDWKYCLQADCDGYIPLHKAVLNNDVSLLKRQCIVLKTHKQSVDITYSGNATALQLALLHDFGKCTSILLQYGADPLIPDDEGRTPLHLAAEVGSENVKAILDHCQANARAILRENEGLWRESFDSKSDQVLRNFIVYKMCIEYDNQGYTPLMLASRIGNAESVKMLLEALPESVNIGMPNCGNTPLYLVVSAACLDCQERGDKTQVEKKYLDTIATLLENGADPSMDNTFGANTNSLLTEFCISKISMLVANKLTAAKYHRIGKMKNFDSYMLLKGSDGLIDLKEIKTPKEEPMAVKEESIIKSTCVINVNRDRDHMKNVASKRKIVTPESEKDKIQQTDSDKAKIRKKQDSDKIEVLQADSDKGKVQKDVSDKIEIKSAALQTDLKDKDPLETVMGKKVVLKYVPVSNKNVSNKIHTPSEASILKIDSQTLKPFTIKDTKPLQFVKILPKPVDTSTITNPNVKKTNTCIVYPCNAKSRTKASTDLTKPSLSIKRVISSPNSDQSVKKSKL